VKKNKEKKAKAIAFLNVYKAWLKEAKMDMSQHPWKHFEQGNPPKTEVVE
jgi:hypothetical protein